MKVYSNILLVAFSALPLLTGASEFREVSIIVRDTLGNPMKQYRVEVVPASGGTRAVYESPKTLRLPAGWVTLLVTASLHRPVKEDVEVSPKLDVIMVGLVRPTGSEITGQGSPANPSIRISVGPTESPTVPAVVRVIGVYSSYSKYLVLKDPQGSIALRDLPFGEYRLLVFANGKLIKEFALVNEEFTAVLLRALTPREK